MNRVFHSRLVELEVDLFDTGVLRAEGATSVRFISICVPPNMETRLGSVPALTETAQSSRAQISCRGQIQPGY